MFLSCTYVSYICFLFLLFIKTLFISQILHTIIFSICNRIYQPINKRIHIIIVYYYKFDKYKNSFLWRGGELIHIKCDFFKSYILINCFVSHIVREKLNKIINTRKKKTYWNIEFINHKYLWKDIICSICFRKYPID